MDVLAVRIDRARVDRAYAPIVGVQLLPVVVCLVFAVYFVSLGATYAVFVFGIPAVMLLVIAVAESLVWASARRVEHPLEVGPYGMTFDTPAGAVSFPWEAVAALGITPGGRMLAVQLHPQAGPESPGVVSTLTARAWRQLRRRGLRLPLRQVQTSPAELAAAIGHYSRGRWAPALAR